MSATTVQAERRKELQARVTDLLAKNDAINESIETKDIGGEQVQMLTPEKKAEYRSNLDEIKGHSEELALLSEDLEQKAHFSAPMNAGPNFTMGDVMDELGRARDEVKSGLTLGDRFVQSEEFKALGGGKFGLNMSIPFEVKDIYSDLPSGTPTLFGSVVREPMIVPPHRKVRMRDLITVVRTDARTIEYFVQTGFTNAASVVPERTVANDAYGSKPQSAFTYKGVQALTRVIATFETIHRSTLADEPQMAAYINNQLLYNLQLTEDAQILNGTGTSEDLLGIINTPNVQTQAFSTDINVSIRKALTKVELANYGATAVVIHPTDWETTELYQDTTHQYVLPTLVSDGGPPRRWSVPVIQSPAIAVGHCLVGAFDLGATLYDREDANIRTSDSHASLFIQNAVALLAEERVALAVHRPESFCYTATA